MGGFTIMFQILETQLNEGYYNIVFSYNEEYFLAAGQYEDDKIELVILDAIDKEDINGNMLKSDYICYYSLFHDVDKHNVLQHIDKVLEAGIRLN